MPKPTNYQQTEAPSWTAIDQRLVEMEFSEAAEKPEHERQYTWKLIVGIPLGFEMGSKVLAEKLATGKLGNSDNPQVPVAQSKPFKRDAVVMATEPIVKKTDVMMERHFIWNPCFLGLNSPNAGCCFSVVSYSILEEAGTWPEVKIRTGGSEADRSGKHGTSLDLPPSNYNSQIVKELSYLEPDIICLQSISEQYWDRLERFLTK